MNISFDNTDLNSSPYSVIDIAHESVASRDVFRYDLARERGAVVVVAEYRSKEIPISGYITGSSQADLDAKIDALKELLNRQGKNLDIDYASGTRRYKNCYAIQSPIQRSRKDITRAYWSVIFVVPSGVGNSTTATTATVNNVTSASYAGSVSVLGNAKSKPKITLSFDSVVGTLNSIVLLSGSYSVELHSTIVTGDVVVFNIEEKTVTLNGVLKDYVGQFPEFSPGTNAYNITTNGTSRQYDISIEYYPAYL